jgi:micrococcal nuclease
VLSSISPLLIALVLAAVLPTAAGAQALPPGVPDGAALAIVTGHVDGDTFAVDLDGLAETVRLAGIDAPDPGECFAVEAAAWLLQTLPVGASVWLERSGADRDGDDRLLRYTWFQDEDGGNAQLLNSSLVRDGFAGFDDREDTPEYFGRLEKLEARARDRGTGLWAQCGELHAPLDGAIANDGGELPNDDEPAPAAAETAADEPEPIGFTLEEQAYVVTVADYVETLGNSFGRFGALMQDPRLYEDDWTIAVATELATWKFINAEVGRLSAPPAFAEVHALLLTGLANYAAAADQIAYGLDYFDIGALEYALILIEDGNASVEQAGDLLVAIVEERTGGA